MNTKKKLAKELVDAAFSELQHDTGPQDAEYVYQHRLLLNKFLSILDKPWRIQASLARLEALSDKLDKADENE